MDKIKIYSILAFCLIIVQLFYDFQEIIFFIKIAITCLAFVILYQKIKLNLDIKHLFIYAYFTSLSLSFIANINSVNLKEFIVGFSILLIPIGFLNSILLVKNTQLLRKATSKVQLYIVYGAGIILLYTYISGDFIDYQGLGQRFVTQSISPSIISLNANIVIIFCLLHINKKRLILLIPIILSVVLIMLSISKSGIIISMFALIYVGIIKKKYLLIGIVSSLLAIILIAISSYWSGFDIILNYIDSGSIDSFTGRSAIWEVCQKLIEKKKILGYGYNTAGGLLTKYFPYFLVEQAHNAFYESMINLGYVGTFILGIYIVKVIIKSIKYFSVIRNNNILSFAFFIVIMELLRAPTEAAFCQANNIVDVFIFFLSLFIMDYYPYKKEIREKDSYSY